MYGSEQEVRVGFAGLGVMGGPMALRLQGNGWPLMVWNRTITKANQLKEAGAQVAGSLADLANCRVVVLMLFDAEAVRDVLIREGGLLRGETVPDVVVNMSTIDTVTAGEMSTACAAKGCEYLASPVSGSTQFAKEGKLTVIVSGPQAAFAKVEPILSVMGTRVLHIGEGVEANLAKLCINLVIGASSSALMEAIAMTSKGGIDRATYLSILNESVIGSAYSRYKTPHLVELDFTPAHSLNGLDKDYNLIEQTAEALGVTIPITAMVHQQIRAAMGRGEGELDMTGILKQYLRDAGLDQEPS